MRRPRAARGFTIVEIMIALAIGMFITIAIAALFTQSRATYATTDDLARVQENLRYTYQLFTRMVHTAGYRSAPSTDAEMVWSATKIVSGTEGDPTKNEADAITLAFQGSSNGTGEPADGSILNCLGVPVAALELSLNTFSVGPGNNGSPALLCNGTQIVADVENMQILYGDDPDGDKNVDSYVPASHPGLNWNNVRSVRIAILFKSPNVGAAPLASSKQYTLNDLQVGPFNDTFLRRVLTVTLNLRNQVH